MTSNTDLLIDIRNVFKTYTMGEVDVPVLKGADLEIRRGEMLTILGESGSGKGTHMNMILALLRKVNILSMISLIDWKYA